MCRRLHDDHTSIHIFARCHAIHPQVDVTCAADGKTTVFVCNDWLRSDVAGVYPSVELLAGRAVPLAVRYRLHVCTAEIKGAGTTSNVFVELHGAGGKLGPVQLDAPGAFDRGKSDTFELEGYDLGQLAKMVVVADGQGLRPLWNLDHIL
eukprot:349637-Chlamydomonas_euryale.AAC.1